MAQQEDEEGLEKNPSSKLSRSGNLKNLNMGDTPKTIIIAIIVAVLVLLLVPFTGGMGFVTKTDFTANMLGVANMIDQSKVDLAQAQDDVAIAVQDIPNIITAQLGSAVPQSTSQWSGQISTLSDKVTVFDNNIRANATTLSQLASMIENTNSEIDTLAEKITAFETTLGEMEETLNQLELVDEEGEVVLSDTTTKWSRELYTNYISSIVGIDHSISPSRIEDEDDYSVMIYLYNYSLTPKTDVDVTIILSPRTGDRVNVNEDNIYLDSVRSPFYTWFTDIVKRNDGTVRRIVFNSGGIKIPAGTETNPGTVVLRLELTLSYK